jgi:hypothetical protein
VTVSVIPQGSWFIYDVDIRLMQPVRLDRNPAVYLIAPTWSTSYVGRNSAAGVRQIVRDQVDRFANDFMSVNPKR